MPDGLFQSKQHIFRFLVNNKLIPDPLTHSAYEKQGLSFLESELEPALDDLMRGLIPTLQFYSQMKMFRGNKNVNESPAWVGLVYFFQLCRGLKMYFKNRSLIENTSKLQKYARFHQVLDEFVKRKHGN